MADEENMLVPQDTYLKAGIHIGTKFRTKYMDEYIYKIRPDGLAVLNLQKIDEQLRVAAKFLAQYEPDEIMIVSRRENGWKPIKAMKKLTNTMAFTGRYLPGMLTNPELETYIEPKVLLATDAWPDRNAIADAHRANMEVVALCDTNNPTYNIDVVIPCNNKGKKSLGLVFWILTREYLKARGVIKNDEEFTAPIEDFTEE